MGAADGRLLRRPPGGPLRHALVRPIGPNEAGELKRSIELELEIWAPLGWDGELGRIALENAHVNGDVAAEPITLELPAAERLGEV